MRQTFSRWACESACRGMRTTANTPLRSEAQQAPCSMAGPILLPLFARLVSNGLALGGACSGWAGL